DNMKKLRRVIGTVTNRGASGSKDETGSTTSVGGHSGQLGKSNRSVSIASSLHNASPADGSYVSYDTHSMGSHASFASSAGADIDPYSKSDKNFTKLHKWAYLGDVSKLKKFIKKVPIDSGDSEGRSALHLASSQGHADALLFLLGSKGEVEMQDNAGMTPLLRATEKGHIQLVQMLLQKHVDINILDYDGNGAAHLAARTGSTDLLELLLDCGVDCDTQNKLGRSPLHFGCQESHEGVVESLLRRGAEVNVVDKEGVTPLMIASKLGNRQLVDILLDQGADISPKDSSKWTAADYARFTNHNQLHRHLKSLMEGKGSKSTIGLFPQGILSSQEEDDSDDDIAGLGHAMAASATSDDQEEGNSWKDDDNSWSDGSEAASIKEKPKFNISKFIQSSDESPDVPLQYHQSSQEALSQASSNGGLSQNTGPPKPPRLYASSSSLDQPLDDREPQTVDEEEKDQHASKVSKSDDDSWGDSSVSEPKFKPSVKFNTDSDIDDPAVLLAGDSPEKLNFEMDISSNTRRLSQDILDFNSQPLDLVRKDKLLTQMELGSMEFHSSEEVSFGDEKEDEMLPEELESTEKQQENSPLETPVNSPLKSLTHSTIKSPVNVENEEMLTNPPNISSKSSTPTKKQRTPSKERQRNIQISFDSDSEEDQAHTSNRPPRRKSLIPSGKKFGTFPILSSHSASEADEEEEKSIGKRKHKRKLFPGSDEDQKNNSNVELENNINKNSNRRMDSDKEEQSNDKSNQKGAIFASSHEKESDTNEKFDKDSNKESGSWMDSDIEFSSTSLPKDGSNDNNEVAHNFSPVILSPNRNIPNSVENPNITSESNIIQNVTDIANDKDGDRNSPDNDFPTQKSRGSTLSTVVGTLGREGTMQETEELWEANASISPKRRNSTNSSEESSKSETTNLEQDQMNLPEEKSKEVETPNKSNDVTSNKQLKLTESHKIGTIKSFQDKISPTIEEESGSFSLEKSTTSPQIIVPPTKDSVPFRPLLRRRSSVTSDQLIQIMTNTSLNKSNRPRPSRQASVSGLGSIVFSDEESLSTDHHLSHGSHLAIDELDDGISAASTETEESAHINSGLKDSLLTPLSSLPNNMDIGQLQDLVRELRLKLEKESGRRRALESKVAQLKKTEQQERKQYHHLEEELQHKQQEIVSLSSRVSALNYQSHCEEDTGRLKTQSLEDAQHHCQQLEEELASLRASVVHDDQVLESLKAQINTKDCINQSLQERINQLSQQTKNISMKSIQTEGVPSVCTTSSGVQTTNITQANANVQTNEQSSKQHLVEGQTQTDEAIISSESIVLPGCKDQKTNSSQTESLEQKNFCMQTENEVLPKTDEQPSKLHLVEGQTQTDEAIISSESIVSTKCKDQKNNSSQTESLEQKNFCMQTENEELPKTDEQPSKLHLVEGQTQTDEGIISSESIVSTKCKDQKTNSSQTEYLEHKNFGMQTENEDLPKLQTDDPKMEKLPEEQDACVQTGLELLDELVQKISVSSKQLTTPVASTTQTNAVNLKCTSSQTDCNIELQSTIPPVHLEQILQNLESCSTEHTSTQTQIFWQSQLIQTDELQLSTLHVQTDMMMNNCEVVPQKQVVNSSCQTMSVSKQMGCQTDGELSLITVDDQALSHTHQDLSSAPSLDVAHQLHKVLSPMIANLTQDMKTVIDESLGTNGQREPEMREALTAALTDHLRILEDRLISRMQQSVLVQNEDVGHQQNEVLKRVQHQLTAQLDTLSQQQQQEANRQFQLKSSEGQDYQQQISRLQSSFQRGMEDLRTDLTVLYGRQGNTSRLAQLEATLMTLTETNKQVQASLIRSVEESRVGSYEALQQMQSHLTTQLLEVQNVIKLAIMSKLSSADIQEEVSRSILGKLDTMEKSIVNSLTPVWDTSEIEGEVRQLSHEVHKKINVLQKSMESSELEHKQLELLQHMNDLKESNKSLASLVKSRSASSVDVSEAVEENFHILQDHIRKLQTTLMAKVNELSQQTSIAEEQKTTWLSKQMSEITTQIAATQCNLSRLQTFVESSASLPTSGHLDETILTTMKVSSDQSLASLKFQNQSVISLLESLQKEVHAALGKVKNSDVGTQKEVQIIQEQLIGREQEVSRLNSLKEDQKDKIHQLNCRIDRLTQQ
ncbi:unnamed protein product, partial [Meganyctiphanes norvegica]